MQEEIYKLLDDLEVKIKTLTELSKEDLMMPPVFYTFERMSDTKTVFFF